MYRTIFIFDISDVYPYVLEAAEALLMRKPALKNRARPQQLVGTWFYYHLWHGLNLAILPGAESAFVDDLDDEFIHFRHALEDRIHAHLSIALHPNALPFYTSWCQLSVGARDLKVIFDMGPLTYPGSYSLIPSGPPAQG